MRSKLVTASLATLAGFSLTANAQSDVTIYGIVDAGIVSESNRSAVGRTVRLESGNQSGSRLGFRGTESLGGGLSALFHLENGFSTDTGAATQGGLLFGRQASVGLKGGFGTIRLGRLNTPTFNAHIALDPFGTGSAGASTNMFTANGFRMDNTINYTAPSLGGFSGELAYGFGETAGNTSSRRQIGLGLGYKNGPVVVRFAHFNANDVTGTLTTKNTVLGGVYNFGMMKLHAAYGVNKNDTTLDTSDALIGVSVPFGASTLLASYISKKDKRIAAADADQISVAYTYDLSKRTNLYVVYSRTDNDRAVRYNAAAVGLDSNIAQVGVRHRF